MTAMAHKNSIQVKRLGIIRGCLMNYRTAAMESQVNGLSCLTVSDFIV